MVPGKQGSQCGYVISRLEAIEVIRVFSEPETAGAQLFITLSIAYAYAAPIIALNNN